MNLMDMILGVEEFRVHGADVLINTRLWISLDLHSPHTEGTEFQCARERYAV